MSLRQNIGQGLVSADQVFLDGYGVLDLEEDDGSSAQEREGEETPVRGILSHEGDLTGIEGPHHCGTRGLNTLVETDVVG